MDSHIPDVLSGRKINWCPGGEGYLSYCPQPTDADEYNYCCTIFRDGIDFPICCRFPLSSGIIYAFVLGALVFLIFATFLSCWCCYTCPLYKRRKRI
uniref:Protein shisa-5 n=1 Tax=Rhabditophanes sp. KR3021 TaxID=114890 RepID=A0AC35U9Z9_9BILA